MENAHRIVSSDAEELILVDADDNEAGFLSKSAAHDGDGILHRAFSLFLFNDDGELLLQQRAASKRLWPGYWSNSCCSHPRRGETMEVATRRRLHDELNVAAELEFVYKFSYQAGFGDAGSEHELCHVFLGRIEGSVHANDHEIAALRFVSAAALENELERQPERFTPWFKLEWKTLREQHPQVLQTYLDQPT
ncbi:MAG: isopentenyl-diphosphate Delta-isomerase [Woeseiaceae bacterium]|nr:isopentenyl-diphosphate Delta-isomerase [Woeseiaceae bacterium]